MVSFAVVAIVRERREVLEAFVDHYLSLGAVEIALYCDGPKPEGFKPPTARVRIVKCDAAFWRKLGLHEPVHHQRQCAAYAHYVVQSPGDWTLVVDADELVFGDAPIGELLDSVPPEVEGIRLPTAEAIYGPGDDEDRPFGSTWFRVATPRALDWALPIVYGGAVAQLMQNGLLGHSKGKQFVRSGDRGLDVKPHFASRGGADVTEDARRYMPNGKRWWVGHFDAVSFSRWMAKWTCRIGQADGFSQMREVRQRQQNEALEAIAAGGAEARKVFRRSYCLTGIRLTSMRVAGLAFERQILG